jgi:hypothetical protein
VRVQVAGKIERQNNHDDEAYADWVIAPVLAVRPNWKTPYKRDNNNYRENEQERHDLGPLLTVARFWLPFLARADSATRGCAISFFTLASTLRLDGILALLSDMHG